jgi:hypothetical protein
LFWKEIASAGPDQGLGVFLLMCKVFADRLFEVRHAGERALGKALLDDFGEEARLGYPLRREWADAGPTRPFVIAALDRTRCQTGPLDP